MRELIQLESPSEHACEQPSVERWQVLEPIVGRWSWMIVFSCCDQLVLEPLADEERAKRAA
jgi:hypothetical protein